VRSVEKLRSISGQNAERIKKEDKQREIDCRKSLEKEAKDLWENSLKDVCERAIWMAAGNGKFSAEVEAFTVIGLFDWLHFAIDQEFERRREDLGACLVQLAQRELEILGLHVCLRRVLETRRSGYVFHVPDTYNHISWFIEISWQ